MVVRLDPGRAIGPWPCDWILAVRLDLGRAIGDVQLEFGAILGSGVQLCSMYHESIRSCMYGGP